jgi:PAS domain S-box-containing protein
MHIGAAQTMMMKKPRESLFPIRVFRATLVITVALFIFFGWLVWSLYRDFVDIETRYLRLQELSGKISYLDEVLTMSTRMSVATGDTEWESRFNKNKSSLETAIREALKLAPEELIKLAVAQAESAEISLIEMENQAFEFVRNGDRKAASAILNSREYENQKLIYIEGIQKLTDAIHRHTDIAIKVHRHSMFFSVALILISLPIFVFVWFFVLRTVRSYVTDQRRAQEVIRESEEKYRTLFETANDAIFMADMETGIIVDANRMACKLLAMPLDRIIGMHRSEMHPKEDTEFYSRGFKDEDLPDDYISRELYIQRLDGELVPVEVSDSIIELEGRMVKIGIFRDRTDRKTLEEQLRHAQKMEAVGRLTAGVAHEFNNILTTIIGFSEHLLEGIDKRGPLKELVDHVMSASERGVILSEGLLVHSRKQPADLKAVNLGKYMKSSEKLISGILGNNIRLEMSVMDKWPRVMLDESFFERVLVNISRNAKDAMPTGGVLRIDCENAVFDVEFYDEQIVILPGKYALISFADSGSGMESNIKKQVFEPFFTTKEVGKGTGLGMSIVYGIIEKHHGYITINSEPSTGTTVNIYLPIV